MNLENLEVGKVYLLKGGRLMRYQGPYSSSGHKPGIYSIKRDPANPCLAFRGVRDDHDPSCPTGYSANASEVIREMTDRSWLKARRNQARARNLEEDALDAEQVLSELVS